MNTLLYCSHIGETLHCESEESKERAGYGDGAMVVYSTINNPGMSNKQ
ncbi:MAG: hypothetical protein HON32_04990 [Francisellaceae bacterium]|nr:hypothetical protein [Francisellaceae bacterium]MBT6538187.1 hypothetical protein [Francisellaceae bacterium]